MARDKQDITDAEMAVMQVLWGRGRASVRQIVEELHGGRVAPAQYATVQKQLERLEKKGFVHHDRAEFVHVFAPAIGRDELIGRRLREMADKLCEGSLAPVLSHLAKSKSLSEEESQALRKLFEELYGAREDRHKHRR